MAAQTGDQQIKDRRTLGRKGRETRARLLTATKHLLETQSPFSLTVSAIAKAAQTGSTTFYLYFDDIQDVFYALNLEAQRAFEDALVEHAEWLSDPARIETDAQLFVDAFNRIWDEHHHALQYRNLEADRGNRRFLDLRTVGAVPVIDRLAMAVMAARPDTGRREAYADAIVLFSGVERMAAARHQVPADKAPFTPDELSPAQARIIARYLQVR